MKKLICMVLSVIMLMSFMGVCYADYATDNLPSDLPPGAIRIMDGVYQVPRANIMPQNSFPETNIGTVPSVGTIIQPWAFNNIQYDSSGRYIHVDSNDTIRINFVSNSQNIFGSNVFSWPSTSPSYTLYIDAPDYGMVVGRSYQLQCTGMSDAIQDGPDGNGVKLHIWSDNSTNAR